MSNHPNRGTIMTQTLGGEWKPATEFSLFSDVKDAATTNASLAALLSMVMGVATRRSKEAATDAVVNFGCDAMLSWIERGETTDPVIRAFFDRRGALKRDALEKAANLLLGSGARQ